MNTSYECLAKSAIDYIAPPIEQRPCEIGLLFGTRHGDEKFCEVAHEAYKKNMFKRLIVSGGSSHRIRETEAEVLASKLVGLGMPESIILVEDKALNTGENVEFSRSLIGDDAPESIFIIGKISSFRRYFMTLKKCWPEIRNASGAPVNYHGVDRRLWFHSPDFRARVFNELSKIPDYIQRGFIEEVDNQYIGI